MTADPDEQAQRAADRANEAALAEQAGDLDRAVALVTEAIELTLAVERTAGDRFGTTALRANACALRAQAAMRAGRVDDAFADVDLGLTTVDSAATGGEVPAINLHTMLATLLMATGRLQEAEEAALHAVELALAWSPELAAHPYTLLALIADAVGADEHATMYRRLADNPHGDAETGGARPVGGRWRRCVERNAQGAALARQGDYRAAVAAFDEAYRETLVPDDDVEALVCRAAVAGNRAGLAATLGDFDDALRLATETIELTRAVEARADDTYGTVGDRVNALTTRAQYLRYRARHADALRDLDEAAASAPAGEPAAATIQLTRAAVLASAGRFEDAAAATRTALDLADRVAPHLIPYAHMTLAEVTEAVGDTAASAEHLEVAGTLFAAAGDANGEATALLSLGRLSYLADQHAAADERYGAAEALFERIGHTLQLVTCLHGRAAVAVRRGRPDHALTLLDRVLAALGDDPAPDAVIATYQVQGSAYEALGEFAEADERYGAARDHAERAGLWHAVLGTDWWRADALARWAATVPDGERLALRRRALDLALPAALAAEALRHRFSPGPLRERWVALATAPATRAALAAIAALDDIDLAAAYLDHLTATVTLSGARPTRQVRADELAALPAPDGDSSALPPRVRTDPGVRTPLDDWIDRTETRYGLAVRSPEVVRSW